MPEAAGLPSLGAEISRARSTAGAGPAFSVKGRATARSTSSNAEEGRGRSRSNSKLENHEHEPGNKRPLETEHYSEHAEHPQTALTTVAATSEPVHPVSSTPRPWHRASSSRPSRQLSPGTHGLGAGLITQSEMKDFNDKGAVHFIRMVHYLPLRLARPSL